MEKTGSLGYESVLIVDDSKMDSVFLKSILTINGFTGKITVENDPVAGLNSIRESEGKAPDLIFLDLNMPQINGFEFLEAFELLSEETKGDCKFIMVTSSDDPEDIRRAREFERVIHYFVKPVKASDLAEMLVGERS